MPGKEVKDEFLMTAIVKLAIYLHCKGYIKDYKGVEKYRSLEEYLTSEELKAVEPYMASINDMVNKADSYMNDNTLVIPDIKKNRM